MITAIGPQGDAPKLTERQLQDNITGLCRWLGLLCYHTHDSRNSSAGFPDLVIVGTSVIFAELKSATSDMTKAQTAWADAISEAGNGCHFLWRPADWWSGAIRTQLEALITRAAGQPRRRRPL